MFGFVFLSWSACFIQLVLVILAFRRGRTGLSLPLSMLGLLLFIWTCGNVAWVLTGDARWNRLESIASALLVPVCFHFTCGFVGHARRWRSLLAFAYVGFGLLSLSAGLAAVFPFFDTPLWNWAFLVLVAVVSAFGFFALGRHLRTTENGAERRRTGALFFAFGLLLLLGGSDLIAGVGIPIPRLGYLGAVCSSLVMAGVALSLEETADTRTELLAAAAGAAFLCSAAAFMVYAVKSRAAAPLLGLGALCAAALLLSGHFISQWTRRWRQLQQYALLGQMADQISHDFRNPLAALRGAVDYLLEERRQGRAPDPAGEFLTLISDQIRLLQRVADKYRSVEVIAAQSECADLKTLLSKVHSRHAHAHSGIEVTLDIQGRLPPCRIDGDLLTMTLENLIQNAVEAMVDGGQITLRAHSESSGRELLLEVQDTGQGMDARTRERCLEPLFTTKAKGSGLGLSFAHQVVLAHGGSLSVFSQQGRGTSIRLRLMASRGES